MGGILGTGLGPNFGPDLLGSGGDIDISRQNELADRLKKERAEFQDRAGATADRTDQDQIRAMQLGALGQLQDAATGKVMSPAELQLRRQASTDAARQFGMAAALKGHSPGGALRQASEGASQVNSAANANAAILRAQETAAARNAYAQALQGTRGQDQSLAFANLDAATKQRVLDDQMRLGLLGGEVTTTAGLTQAQIEAMKDRGQRTGAFLSAGGAAGTTLLASDARAKTKIRKKSLADALAEKVHGVSFEYLPKHKAEGGDGEKFGVIAQDIEKVLPGAVAKGPDGIRRLHVGHLAAANTAILSELSRRVGALEGAA